MQDPRRLPENPKMFHVEHFSLPSHWGLFLSCYSFRRTRKSRHALPLRTTCYLSGSQRVGGTRKVNIRSLYDIFTHRSAGRTPSRSPQRRAHHPKRKSPPTCYSCDSCQPRHMEEPIWIPLCVARREMRLRPTCGGAGHAGSALDRKPRRQIASTFPPVARPVINRSASCLPRVRAPRIAASQPPPASRIPRAVVECAPLAEIR